MAMAMAAPSLTVFIDTTLDTHLLMLLSLNDSVFDFKRKIEKEHMLCFPDIGEIVVHALKVKRRGYFYCLSDSMLVKDAFGLANRNWFLSVDASAKKREEEGLDNTRNLGNAVANGVCIALDMTPEQGTSDPRREREVSFEHVEQVEKFQPDMAVKNGKRKIEQVVAIEEDLREENIGLGKDTSKPEMISQTQLGDKERSENVKLDGLTMAVMDDNRLVMSKKRKKSKRKVDKVTDDVPTHGKDVLGAGASVGKKDSDELDAASKGENVEKLSESRGVSSKVREEDAPAIDIRRGTDESEKETSAANKMDASKGVESNRSVAMEKPERAEEQGALSNRNASDRMQSNDLDSPRREETGVKRKDVDGAGNLVDKNESVAPPDTGKKRKINKKAKDLVGKVLTTSGGPEVQGSDINILAEQPENKKGRNEETILSPKDGNKVPKENNESMVVAKEGAVNEVKTNENSEKLGSVKEEPVKKKLKKKQKPSTTNLPEPLQVEAQGVTKTKVVASSKTKKKSKPAKDQTTVGKLDFDSVPIKPKSVPAKSTKAQPHSLDHGDKKSGDEPDLASNPPKITGPTETKKQTEVSVMGNENSLEKPLPSIVTSGEVLADKKEIPKAKKSAKNPDTHSVQTSSNVQSSLKSNRKQGTLARNSGTVAVRESALDKKSDESMAHLEKKLPRGSTNAVAKAPPTVVNGTGKNKSSGENGENSPAVSNSLSERQSNKRQVSQSAPNFKNPSNRDNGPTIKSSGPEKKLLATSVAIFNTNTDVSSDDEGTKGSEDSTRTPSDCSSDDSEGEEESNANSKSLQNGSTTSDKRDILKSCPASGKNDVTFDGLLRSSSRFKNVIQSQESQQVDFVPDSQANP